MNKENNPIIAKKPNNPGGTLSESLEYSPSINSRKMTITINQILDELNKSTDAPDEFLLPAFLGYWAGVVGNKIIGPNDLRPNIWITLIAGSSIARKSTALSVAGKPFNKVQSQLDNDWIKGNNSRKKIVLPNDFSGAGLYMLLKDNPYSGTVIANEFHDFYKKLKRDYTDMDGALLSSYDNDTMTRCTRDHGEEVVENPTFSILGATTMVMLEKVMSKVEYSNGFMQRLLPVVLYQQNKERMSLLNRVNISSAFIYSWKDKINAWLDTTEKEVELSQEVKSIFSHWESAFIDNCIKQYPNYADYGERQIISCLKLAMLIETLDSDVLSSRVVLSKESLECAISLIEDLFMPSSIILATKRQEFSPEEHRRYKIKKELNHGALLYTDLSNRLSSNNREYLKDDLSALENEGLISITELDPNRGQSGGRKKKIIELLI